MRTVVVYYSRFGTTRTVAKAIAEELGAELREIQAVRECGFLGMAFRSLFGIRMPIRPMNLDQVVLCTPIWAGRPANPVRTFLQVANLEGKRLAVVFTAGIAKSEPALGTIRKLLSGKNVAVTVLGTIITLQKDEAQLRAEAKDLVRKLGA